MPDAKMPAHILQEVSSPQMALPSQVAGAHWTSRWVTGWGLEIVQSSWEHLAIISEFLCLEWLLLYRMIARFLLRAFDSPWSFKVKPDPFSDICRVAFVSC